MAAGTRNHAWAGVRDRAGPTLTRGVRRESGIDVITPVPGAGTGIEAKRRLAARRGPERCQWWQRRRLYPVV